MEPEEPEIPEFLRGYKDSGPSWNDNTSYEPSKPPTMKKLQSKAVPKRGPNMQGFESAGRPI
jgi:hypothetical protein